MPQIYNRIPTPPTVTERHRSSSVSSTSSSSSSSSLSDTPRPTDVDDSIVLSDLVRTGEASRLRRRGAMRLDHGHHNAHGYTPRETSPTPWDSDDEPGVVTYPHRQRRFSSSRRRRQEEEESEVEEYRYTLVCGAEIQQSGVEEDPCEPWRPSILPIPPATSSSTPQKPTQRKTNGCGAIVHLRAAPRPRVHMWAARTPAPSCVVPLEAHYFDAGEAAKFERSSCGCVKEGVGCAVCGNPLGTRYIPCRMAASGMFSPGHKHYTSLQAPWTSDAQPEFLPMCPEGPRYWHASPSSFSMAKSTFHVHSFFSTAVTSYPEYSFPPKDAPPQVPPSFNSTTVQEPYFDRPITSSPFPFESSTFWDRESGSPPPGVLRTHEEDPLHSHEPTPSLSSSFYRQTNPPAPSFYQQQFLTAWDREREQTRRPTPGAGAGRRRRETWNGFENENEDDQEQDADTDVGVWGVWGGGLGSVPMSTGGGWMGIDEEDLQWRGEGYEGYGEGGRGEEEEEGEGADKGEGGEGMWLER